MGKIADVVYAGEVSGSVAGLLQVNVRDGMRRPAPDGMAISSR
jgi:hypothetical protein